MKKKFVLFFGFLLLFYFGINVKGEDNIEIKKGTGVNDQMLELLLEEPFGKKIGEFSNTAEVEVVEEKDGWVKVKVSGWLKKSVEQSGKTEPTDKEAVENEDKNIFLEKLYLQEADKLISNLSSAMEEIKSVMKLYDEKLIPVARVYSIMESYSKLVLPENIEIFTTSGVMLSKELLDLRDCLLNATSTFEKITYSFNPLNPHYSTTPQMEFSSIKKYIKDYKKDIKNYKQARDRFQ